MVFLGGPRQVGKTTFAREMVGAHYKNMTYYNWDYAPDRRELAHLSFPGGTDLLVLDEIHKYKKWKGLVKGLFDKRHQDFATMVTGSARMDIYRRGGDSLMGRYHYYRMHPFSLSEAAGLVPSISQPGEPLKFAPSEASNDILKNLMEFGGFPEPFLAKDERVARRWRQERLERLFREDIRDVEIIRELGSMELLASILPQRTANLLSINALREDLDVSHKAVSNWLNILEKFYYHFRIYPFASRKIRSLKKEPKLYLWDWAEVDDMPRRFENLVAGHLLKFVHYLHDAQGYDTNLHFLRDVDGREVDFIVSNGGKPWFAVEVKMQEQTISRHLSYFAARLGIPYLFQVVMPPGVDQFIGDVRLLSADRFLAGLV